MSSYRHWRDSGKPVAYLMDHWLASQSGDPSDKEEYSWAFSEPVDDAREDPEKAWEYILFAVDDPRFSPGHLRTLAAGALEDLLSFHGPGFIDRVEQRARMDPRFAHMLGGVWQFQMTEDIWRRVQAVWNPSE